MGILLSKDNQTPTATKPEAEQKPETEPAEDQPQKPRLRRSGSIFGEEYRYVADDYKILKQIGSGKFAYTYLCKKKSTGQKYACKSIPKKRLVMSEKEDLKREVEIMKFLKDAPNVVQLIELYEDHKYVHLIMEYCEGGELFDKMVSKGMFSEKVAAQILGSIMKFLALLHGMGVMHRDLKPENFLLPKGSALGCVPCAQKGAFGPCLADDYSRLKAIDFGLSAYTDEVTQDKVGTAFYVAPEVLRRQPYGEKVDIWSAGVILYMLLTGAPPFYGDTDEQIFERILQREKPDMESYPWTKRSKKAKKLVEIMLSWDPKKRPNATQVLNDQWMKDNGVEFSMDDAKLSDKVKRFRAMYKFKKLALKIMTEIIPQEELEKLKAVFYNFDTDEKKAISPEELKSSLAKLEPEFNEEEINSIVEAADADGNKSIDYDEFITTMMNFRKQHKAELRKLFKQFDKKGNGVISKKELQSVLEEKKLADEATIKEIIEQVDVNKDGQISFMEFFEMIKS